MIINYDLYNFYTRNKKAFIWGTCIFLLFISFLMIYNYKIIGKDTSIFLYTYSTVVQGFLALVGFLGTVTIFKLQLIENEGAKISVGLEPYLDMYKGQAVKSYSWLEMMSECDNVLKDPNSNLHVTAITAGHNKLTKLRDEKSEIRNVMVDFALLSVVNIIFALVNLPISQLFVSKELFGLNVACLLVSFALSILSATMSVAVIRRCLGYSFKMSIR